MSSIVIDVGSSVTKAGFAAEEAPRETFHSVIGLPRERGVRTSLLGYNDNDYYVAGDKAYHGAGLLELQHPVEHGMIVNYHTYEQLLLHTYYAALHSIPHDQPTLLLEAADMSRQGREQVAEMMFESFMVSQLGLLNSLSSTLYSTGYCSGISVDSGAGKTAMGAIVEGYLLQHTLRVSLLAGDFLTNQLFNSLRECGYCLSTLQDWRLVEEIKEKRCRVATNLTRELNSLHEHGTSKEMNAYELPDNERIFLFDYQYTIPEMLFDVDYIHHDNTASGHCLKVQNSVIINNGNENNDNITNTHNTTCNATKYSLLRSPTKYTSSNVSCTSPFLHGWAQSIQEIVRSATVGVNAFNTNATSCITISNNNNMNPTSSPSSPSSSPLLSSSSYSKALTEELYSHVVLGGGTTLIANTENRLQYDLTQLVEGCSTTQSHPERSDNSNTNTIDASGKHSSTPTLPTGAIQGNGYENKVSNQINRTSGKAAKALTVRCVAFPERAYAAWLGGSIWASTPAFRQSCLTKETYDECGASCVHQYTL